ncbi:MAG: hypothetical protein ACP5PW_06720 [Candidatus Dormibacteria bacterium]
MDARWRWTFGASVAVAAVLASSAAVLAGTGVSSVSGFEIAATSTDGQFVGSIGSGTKLAGGYFYANVIHQVLNEQSLGSVTAVCGTGEQSSPDYPCNSLPNPPISAVTVYLPSGASVTGQFEYAASGTGTNQGIVFESGTGSCPSTQTFSVGDLVDFGAGYGSYEFLVTLTHYSYDLFGDCITYFATISGTMTPKQSS